MKISGQLLLLLALCSQSTGFAAEILCVERFVPRDFVKRSHVFTEQARKTIALEYQRLLGVPPPEEAVCTTVAVVGPIKTGDFDTLSEVYRASKGWLETVALVSLGGNLNEGMRIGRLIRKAMLSTSAPLKDQFGNVYVAGVGSMDPDPCADRECACASTCFVVWVAGYERHGNFLGIHRPTFEREYFGGMPPQEAEKLYEQAIKDLADYLDHMNVPRTYYGLLMKTPSWEIKIPWESIENDLTSPYSDLWERHASPAIDEWLAARCGSIQAAELVALRKYYSATDHEHGMLWGSPYRWKEVSDPAYQLLAKKIYQVSSCRRANRLTVVFERYRDIVTGR